MAVYDSDLFDPPAPLARVTLRAIQTRKIIRDVPMLIDSGSDLTLIPEASIAELSPSFDSDKRVELQGFDGRVTVARSVELDLIFLGTTFRGHLPLVDSPIGVLGRNVLNRFAIFLDGPNLNWDELSRLAKSRLDCRDCFPDDVIPCPNDGAATTVSIAGEPILDGRYQLEKRLGQGGMGVVYKARHIFLKTSHAIKIILPDLVGNDPNLVTRFRQEALAAAAIRHQNIIAVTDFGVVRGTMPFLVMEFVQGASLQDVMAEEGAMSPVRAFELMQPICAGIAAAHRQGIVHRDLKPLNVMIQADLPINEAVKILDFGLAKIKSGELLGSFIAAQTTGLMGSPFYMAPEQWSDEPPDARADVYSLGVMLFQMLCGEVPFKGSSIPAIMKKHLTEHVPSFISKGVSVPPEIEVVVRHALEKEPQDRTESADEFAKELRAAMSHASAMMSRTGDSPAVDPSKTLVSPPPPQTSVPPSSYSSYSSMSSGSTSLHDPLAGTISSASLAEEEQKNLFAQQELAREAEVRRKIEREAAAKRKTEAEAKLAEEARLAEAARLKAEEEKRAEEARLQAEAQQRAAEEARAAEQRRLAEQKDRKSNRLNTS